MPYRTTSGKIEGAVMTFVDLSEQLAAQERAREAEDRLMRAITISEDLAVVTTDESGVDDYEFSVLAGWSRRREH